MDAGPEDARAQSPDRGGAHVRSPPPHIPIILTRYDKCITFTRYDLCFYVK